MIKPGSESYGSSEHPSLTRIRIIDADAAEKSLSSETDCCATPTNRPDNPLTAAALRYADQDTVTDNAMLSDACVTPKNTTVPSLRSRKIRSRTSSSAGSKTPVNSIPEDPLSPLDTSNTNTSCNTNTPTNTNTPCNTNTPTNTTIPCTTPSNSCKAPATPLQPEASAMKTPASTQKTEDYDSGISSPSSSSPPVDSIEIKIAAKKRRRKRRRGTTLAGACFEDCYERTGRILGSGAFSQVELCRCVRTGHEFAVKIIKKDTWYNGYTRTRVHQEVEILYRCTGHPNIVQLQDFYEGKDEFYLVFEMMRGGALIDHIEKRKTFDERAASTILYCITSALEHLHSAGIAHRDLKFDNLLCNDPEDFTQVKICDFDLGGQKLDIPYLSTPLMDSPVGSAEFMAPEVVDLFVGHKSTYDKRCDMWSLGITLYIMLFGRPPFTGRCGLQCGWDDGEACAMCQELLFQSITSGRITFPTDSTVSESAKDLIRKLLVKDARMRYTAQEVLKHPWILNEGTDNVLSTPANLRRNTLSATNLGNFAAKANQHYRMLNAGLNGLSEALDNLNLQQLADEEKEGAEEEPETTPELTPTTDKGDFFISEEDDWFNVS